MIDLILRDILRTVRAYCENKRDEYSRGKDHVRAREWALAVTHLEDADIRMTRAFDMEPYYAVNTNDADTSPRRGER